MLTSPGNQYLRPEYLTPLPTTLDAKKSPLALLAQTCSQIGADSPNSKLLQSSEKSSTKSNKSDQSSKEKSSSANNSDSNHKLFKSYDTVNREKSRSPEERSSSASTGTSRVRTPLTSSKSNLSASNNNDRCSSNQSATSPRSSPLVPDRKTPAAQERTGSVERTTPSGKSSGRESPQTPSTKTAFTPNILTSSSDPAIKDLPLGTFKPGVPVSSAFLSGYPPTGFPLTMDLMASSLMSPHHLKSGGLNPYLNYGRLKTADPTLPAVCRDPYCTGCSVSSHLLGVKTSTCPAGCSQCDHAKSPQTSAASYLGHSSAAAAYAHAQLAALAAASHLPYICSWISGDASYCGKRYSSSEELLVHLRTHTSVSVSEANSALSMLSSSNLPPTHPLLHRTYPTPPLSPLATARYHPYSKPSLLPPSISSSLSGFPLSHPGLPPYLSPYSLYGPRLGAAPGMHP